MGIIIVILFAIVFTVAVSLLVVHILKRKWKKIIPDKINEDNWEAL